MNQNHPIKRSLSLMGLLTILALILAACAPAAAAPTATVAPTQVPTLAATAVPTAAAVSEPTVSLVENASFGPILVDEKGMTLYGFTKDSPNVSTCAEGCLKAWPPLLTNGSPKAGDGVDAALLGSTATTDGREIVTYNGWPLYYWASDVKPGDTTGQNVGEVWFVVNPAGEMVMSASVPTTGNTNDNANSNTNDNSNANSNDNGNANEEDDYSKNPGASGSDDVKLAVAKVGSLGDILVDAKGMTLYMFAKDTANTSNCTGDCLKKWPPFLAGDSEVKAEDGVDESLVGAAKMADGRMIVTYNGMPLYYWAADVKPGDATGQNVGEVWFVVAPDGKPIK